MSETLDIFDRYSGSHAQLMAMSKILELDTLSDGPMDAWIWVESPFVHLENGFNSILSDFLAWESHAPLDWRCFIYKDLYFEKHFDKICEGVALEVAHMGGISALNDFFSQRRPTLLQNLRNFKDRVDRVYSEAGSREELERLAASVQEKVVLTDEEKSAGEEILKRSSVSMNAMIGDGAAEKFLANEELVFNGKRYSFVVSGINRDHIENSVRVDRQVIPYRLDLRTIDGEQLAHGCVVFKGSPVLDQVTALYAHVIAGEERHIVQTAIWTERQPLFDSYVSAEDWSAPREHVRTPHPERFSEFTPDVLRVADELLQPVTERLTYELTGGPRMPVFRPEYIPATNAL